MTSDTVMQFGLETKWLTEFENIFKQHTAIQKVVVFGSRARGSHKRYSDVDLCLFGTKLSELDAQRIQESLEDLYHPYMVDVVAFQAISDPVFRQRILEEGQVMYKNSIAGS